MIINILNPSLVLLEALDEDLHGVQVKVMRKSFGRFHLGHGSVTSS